MSTNPHKPVIVGAVLYDPKVSVIWDIIREFFEENGCLMDVVFYTNYELQNQGLLDGHLDIAWNSPLAWVDALRLSGGTCRAIAMRDTDRDRVSHIIVKNESGIQTIEDLRGKTIAFGAKDSPQARLIPQGLLLRHGLAPDTDYTAKRFDILVGKHGDHIGGERASHTWIVSSVAVDSLWVRPRIRIHLRFSQISPTLPEWSRPVSMRVLPSSRRRAASSCSSPPWRVGM